MKIGIIPVISREKNTFYKVDVRLFDFLKFCFGKTTDFKILHNNKKNIKLDLIISCGGNDLVIFKKNERNILRNRLDHFYINLAVRKKIPYLGICYGAQKLAHFFKSKLKKTNIHNTNYHDIKILNENIKIKRKSHHNFKIYKLGKKLINKGFALNDNSYEFFKHKYKKMYGLMWHPERLIKFSLIEKKIFKKIL